MSKPLQEGLYIARVCKGKSTALFADEETARFNQTAKMFTSRDEKRRELQAQADRKAAKQAAQRTAMIRECTWLIVTIVLVAATYAIGKYAAVASVAGCAAAMICRIIEWRRK